MSTPWSPQRHDHLLAELAATGRVGVATSAADLGVSHETVRKDLVALEAQGLLTRVHGGAVAVTARTREPAVVVRTEHAGRKLAIARAALAQVPAGGSVLLDAGSTVAALAHLIAERARAGAASGAAQDALVVWTATLPTALVLADAPGVRVHVLTGHVRSRTHAAVGGATVRQLADLNVDVALLGTNGLSLERGLTTPDPAEAEVKRASLAAAERRVLLCDHSKIGVTSLCRHADLADIDLLVTDAGIDPDDAARLRATGLDLEIA